MKKIKESEKILLFLICSLGFFFGCKNPISHDEQSSHDLVPSKIITIPIDSVTRYKSHRLSVFQDSILVYQNEVDNSIYFFSLNTQQVIKKITYQQIGENGVGIVTGFYMQSMDSIYILGRRTAEITLTDSNGTVLNRWRPKEKIDSLPFGNLIGLTFFPIEKMGNSLYISSLPDVSLYTTSLVGQELEIRVDLKTGSYTPHFFFPKDFEGFHNVFYVTYSRIVDEKGNFIYSFPMSHDLYVKNSQGEIRTEKAKSSFADTWGDIQKATNLGDVVQEEKAYIEGFSYRYIVFDEYRDVYYRFVEHPTELVNPIDGRVTTFEDKPSSVIILNDDFQKIGEYYLGSEKYLISNYFVNSKGLWISNSNLKNPSINEDVLSFTLFELIQK